MTNSTLPKTAIFATDLRITAAIAAGLLLTALIGFAPPPAQAQTFQVLHSFADGDDGAIPLAGLIMDTAGNLYGTASGGGKTNDSCETYGCGVAFRLVPSGTGWILRPLYVFQGGFESGPDGSNPEARMVFGADGVLYGTTAYGGEYHCNNSSCGTVFKLSPPATACKSALCPWDETVVYRFLGNPHAGNPNGGPLVFDQQGNLYGAANWGPTGYGTVYELSNNGGTWSETDIFSPDYSSSGLVADNAGNLYGTNGGGFEGGGGVYQLVHSGSGWHVNQLFGITNYQTQGADTYGGVVLDSAGNIYASTAGEGPSGGGTIFELSAGAWNFNLLYGLSGNGGPEESLSMDSVGNLYGTTYADGAYGYGSVFELTPSANGWTYTDLYDFTGGSDGRNPISNVVIDAHGNLYGTATRGGSGPCTNMYYGNGCGVVWEITP